MLRKLTIGWRMTLLILAGAGCIMGAIIGFSYLTARRLLEEELRDKAQYLARATANRIEAVQVSVEKIAEGMAYDLENGLSLDAQYALLEAMVGGNDEIFGACVAPAPPPGSTEAGVAPYVCRSRESGQGLLRMNLAEGGYNYLYSDWYTLPRDLGCPQWTEPYFDKGAGNILMVTYSVPLFAPGDTNVFLGVVTCDVSLEWLTDLTASLPVGKNGYAFLISGQGTYITHRRKDFIMNESVFSVAEQAQSALLRDYGHRMTRGEVGFGPLVSLVTGIPSWFAFAPVESTRWSVGLVFPKDELLAKVFRLSRIVLFVGIAGFALMLVVVLAIARSITSPLRQLEGATAILSKGNLDALLPVIPGEDEVAHLASSFDTMRRNLKQHVEDLRTTTAAKERIESEIHIARSIQMSLVPRTFPPFPDHGEFDLYALLDPARDIGGDFYDFFMCENQDLCMVVGDVSGKGVPAALFMAVTRTFLKTIWRMEQHPAPTLTRLNNELAIDNEPNMFVTLFCVRVNVPTGKCRYANGGHNPPFIIREDGSVDRLPRVAGTLVGALEDRSFEEGQVTLAPGETLFLYTDGVTEALDPAGRLSGEAWTIEQLRRARKDSCANLINDVREALKQYAAGAEQSDDITMLAFRYRGPNG